MVILMIIFVLTVLSGAYLFSGMALSAVDTKPPEYLVWTFITDYDDESYTIDALIITTDTNGKPVQDVSVSLYTIKRDLIDSGETDERGRLMFYGIDPQNYINSRKGDYSENFHLIINSLSQYNQFLSRLSLYVQAQVTDLDEDNVRDDVAILVLNRTFEPISNVEVTKGSKSVDDSITNVYGLSRDFNLLKDDYEYSVNWNDIEANYEIEVLNDDLDIENLLKLEGPDDVLMQTASLFLAMIIPIIAIGLSFDSISKEKISKSIVFLLCRPIGKRSIAVGKFLGSTLAIAIPLTIISLAGVAVISSKTGESPSGGFVAGFIAATIVFMAIFVLLQQIFSTLAKSTGNAILAGISLWLFFYMFYGLIVIAINLLVGNQLYSVDFNELSNKITLGSPVGVYGFILNAISPSSTGTPVGLTSWAPFAAFTIWFILLFVLALELFRKRPYL
jgi:ABC-type transport system involved in multi-copper enzyme maturation permease subunit